MPADPSVSPAATIRRVLQDSRRGIGYQEEADSALSALDALLAVGERDRQHIRDLTEALKDARVYVDWFAKEDQFDPQDTLTAKEVSAHIAAVLAGEEDAANG